MLINEDDKSMISSSSMINEEIYNYRYDLSVLVIEKMRHSLLPGDEAGTF